MAAIDGMTVWTNDYLADTKHFSTVQHGAYFLILMAMWRSGGSIPNDEKRIARIAGISMDKWKRVRTEIMELLTVSEDGKAISQKRLGLEYKKTIGLVQKRKLAGSSGGRSKALKNKDSGLANATANAEAEVPFCAGDSSPSPILSYPYCTGGSNLDSESVQDMPDYDCWEDAA